MWNGATGNEFEYTREQMEKFLAQQPCQACKGRRLRKKALAVLVAGKNITEVTEMSVTEAYRFEELESKLTEKKRFKSPG